MPDNNRLFRIIKIMMLLNKPYDHWNAKKFAGYFDISVRTFHRDKKMMEDLGIPIYYNKNLKEYKILDTIFKNIKCRIFIAFLLVCWFDNP